MAKAHPRRWEINDALSHPMWTSPIYYLPHRKLIEVWAARQLHSTKDLVKPDGTFYSRSEIMSYFENAYEESSRGDFYVKGRLPLSRDSVWKDWTAILKWVPHDLWRAITLQTQAEEWRYSTQSLNAMERMG